MAENICEVNVWNAQSREGLIEVTNKFEVVLDGNVLDVNEVGGLAIAALVTHPHEIIPKSRMKPLAEAVHTNDSPLLRINSRLNVQSALTRGINTFRKLRNNTHSGNFLPLGPIGTAGQCWYFAPDLRDSESVLEDIVEKARASELPQAEAIEVSAIKIFREAEVKDKFKRPDGTGSSFEQYRRLRTANQDDNRELYRMLSGTGEYSDLGDELTYQEIKSWMQSRGIGRMRERDIINLALSQGVISRKHNPKDQRDDSSEVFIRLRK